MVIVCLQYQKPASTEDDIQHPVVAVELTRQAAVCKAGMSSLNQMVFRNTMHMGNCVVIRTQTTTLHPRFGLWLKIDAEETTVHSSKSEPKPDRQVQEHKTTSQVNNVNHFVASHPKCYHAHRQHILHI
jgi:hypothetical protein